jgi:hypothetical protein
MRRPTKCEVDKCRNLAHKETDEGFLCRTHVARKNMFGSVHAQSPTVPSAGKTSQFPKGFNRDASKNRTITETADMYDGTDVIRRKARVHRYLKNSARGYDYKVYKDFERDGGFNK